MVCSPASLILRLDLSILPIDLLIHICTFFNDRELLLLSARLSKSYSPFSEVFAHFRRFVELPEETGTGLGDVANAASTERRIFFRAALNPPPRSFTFVSVPETPCLKSGEETSQSEFRRQDTRVSVFLDEARQFRSGSCAVRVVFVCRSYVQVKPLHTDRPWSTVKSCSFFFPFAQNQEAQKNSVTAENKPDPGCVFVADDLLCVFPAAEQICVAPPVNCSQLGIGYRPGGGSFQNEHLRRCRRSCLTGSGSSTKLPTKEEMVFDVTLPRKFKLQSMLFLDRSEPKSGVRVRTKIRFPSGFDPEDRGCEFQVACNTSVHWKDAVTFWSGKGTEQLPDRDRSSINGNGNEVPVLLETASEELFLNRTVPCAEVSLPLVPILNIPFTFYRMWWPQRLSVPRPDFRRTFSDPPLQEKSVAASFFQFVQYCCLWLWNSLVLSKFARASNSTVFYLGLVVGVCCVSYMDLV